MSATRRRRSSVSISELPQIHGIIESFVGPNPRFDHDWTHHIQPHATYVQPLHVDAITDSEDPTFDVQLFWYPHDVAPGEGGTRFVPGSHLRRVRSSGLDRYQHINGEQQFSGPAGTVVVFHHGLWHAGQPNPGEGHRWMHKVRLNPTVAQVRLWNTDDLTDLQNPPSDHIFARILPDSVAQIFRTWHPWMSVTDYRNEQVQRARLWRYLTGDDTYDVDHYLTRLEGRAALVGDLMSTAPADPLPLGERVGARLRPRSGGHSTMAPTVPGPSFPMPHRRTRAVSQPSGTAGCCCSRRS